MLKDFADSEAEVPFLDVHIRAWRQHKRTPSSTARHASMQDIPRPFVRTDIPSRAIKHMHGGRSLELYGDLSHWPLEMRQVIHVGWVVE